MDFGVIKQNAKLRVAKGIGVYNLEYRNPDSKDFISFVGSFDHFALEKKANEISKIIHDKPQTFTAERTERRRDKPRELLDWEND